MNIFWNKADQKYELIKSPKVNLVVTGIIIANVSSIYFKTLIYSKLCKHTRKKFYFIFIA